MQNGGGVNGGHHGHGGGHGGGGHGHGSGYGGGYSSGAPTKIIKVIYSHVVYIEPNRSKVFLLF